MPTVLITPEAMRHQPGPHVDLLQAAGFDIRFPEDPYFARGLLPTEDLIAELQHVDATIASAEHYSDAVLTACPRLRVIARAGVGYDRVDVEAATRHQVVVTITPTANHEAVAELALALMFAAAKSLVKNDRRVRTGEWPRELLRPIRGQVMGIVGLGRIGRSTAVRCQALGMRVIAFDRIPDPEFANEYGIELVDFTTLLQRADFVSLHCPLTDDTRHLINRSTLQRMKPGCILINTARGGLIHEPDLLEALRGGQLAAAGLDVLEQEPPPRDHPLFALDQVVLSPHLAGTDEVSLEAMGVEAARCIAELKSGEWPEAAIVNRELKGGWCWTSTESSTT